MYSIVNSTHDQLRNQTKQAHVELDQLSCFKKLMSKDLKANDYALSIQALGTWFSKYENHIDRIFSITTHLTHILPKGTLINKDLEVLDFPPHENQQLVHGNHNINNFFFCLGIIYVIEGSTLGGAVIAPRVKKSLKMNNITHYYDCYGEQKFACFSKTLMFIDSSITQKRELDSVIEGAQFAFTDLRKWMLASSQQPALVV